MMTSRLIAVFSALAVALTAPLAAQNTDLGEPVGEGGDVESVFEEALSSEDEGGLTGSTTDTSDWQDLGIAIPAFATDRDQPTPANADGTAALGREIARVITANLRNNGLFQPTGPDRLPPPWLP